MTDVYDEHRSLLFTVPYEMLGSTAEAEDVLQESWLRWAEVDQEEVHDPRAYLVRVVTRQCLNRLRALKRQRESYVGPWLPEPLVTAPDVADDVELADAVSFAMLLVLETLQPLERAVFLLHEVFGFGYDEIAVATDKTTAAVRQLAHRARQHVAERRPRVAVDHASHANALEQFLVAAVTGDVQSLMNLLSPQVVLLTDGGGTARAALRPIIGADKVVRWMQGVLATVDNVVVDRRIVNGAPALLVLVDGTVDLVAGIRPQDGRIAEIYLVRSPDKVAAVSRSHVVSR